MTRKVLLARGVADADILTLPGESGSTHAEAIALGRFLEENPGATVSVVTTNFHTRRARWIFRRVLGKRADGLRFVAAPTDGFDATNWWQFEAGFRTYSSEYLKLLVYVFRYSE